MSTPRIKEHTKKTFHFPKSAKEPAAEAKTPSAKASRASVKKAAPAAEAAATAPQAAEAAKSAPKRTKTAKTAKAAKVAKPVKAAKPTKPEQAASAAKAPKQAKAVKPKAAPAAAEEKKPRVKKEKEKVVRDSFTMPKSDYAKIAELKQRCLDAGISVKKSELLRAGLNLLAVSPAKRLIAAVQELEAVKTGRPAKS
jgi:hypothetical protein